MDEKVYRRGHDLRRYIKEIIHEINRVRGIDYFNRTCIFDSSCYHYISESHFNSFKNKLINDMRRKLVKWQNEFHEL